MSETIPITDQTLRSAMRDPRYWQSNNAERPSFSAWVTEGFRALHDPAASGTGIVHVRAYTRNGRTVAAHDRSAAPSGAQGDANASAPAYSIVDVIPAQGTRGYRSSPACEAQYTRDVAFCGRLAAPAPLRAQCFQMAIERMAQCGRGANIPPLLPWRQ